MHRVLHGCGNARGHFTPARLKAYGHNTQTGFNLWTSMLNYRLFTFQPWEPSVTDMSESDSSYYMKLYASGHRHADRRTVAPVLGHIKSGLGFLQGSVSYPCPHINVTTMFHHSDGISQVMSRAWYSVLKGSIFVSPDQTRAPVLDIQSEMLTHNLNQLLFKGEEGEWKEGFILCTLLLSCLMFWQVYTCTDEWTKRTFF